VVLTHQEKLRAGFDKTKFEITSNVTSLAVIIHDVNYGNYSLVCRTKNNSVAETRLYVAGIRSIFSAVKCITTLYK